MITNLTKYLESYCGLNISYKLFSVYYDSLVKQEISLAKIQRYHKVICVGGGSVPMTAIKIHELTGAMVDVIDIDDQAVSNAKTLIQRLGLSEFIRIYHSSGDSFDYKFYDVIHLAMQLQDKDRILATILLDQTNQIKIIHRLPKKTIAKQYCKHTFSICHLCNYSCIYKKTNLLLSNVKEIQVLESVGESYV
jgi:hypothetical protein